MCVSKHHGHPTNLPFLQINLNKEMSKVTLCPNINKLPGYCLPQREKALMPMTRAMHRVVIVCVAPSGALLPRVLTSPQTQSESPGTSWSPCCTWWTSGTSKYPPKTTQSMRGCPQQHADTSSAPAPKGTQQIHGLVDCLSHTREPVFKRAVVEGYREGSRDAGTCAVTTQLEWAWDLIPCLPKQCERGPHW